ncbi:outer membrane lipoprotein-sorting protein [Pseudomonas sp. SDI]|uniref:outer membrane lipoprotein-sorting protein n=1 Tax=Pseudomonas sp. SDI TaxID=2170734 RepID=UPI000DE75E04|nr:outer membrane lipoprotein-sorting protein [Pseudomonas sp. SDI]PWB35339.1 outer membrane lipoprotein-sorting protein [Pseudomonas sp. SDI]
MSFIHGLCAGTLLFTSSLVLAAPAPNADDIIRQARDREDGRSFMSQVSLVLVDKQGNTRVREFSYLQKDYPDGDKFTMHFSAPSDVRDVAFHIENPQEERGVEDSQWMYLPVSRQTRRISTTDKRGAFMGSDFSYADLDNIRVSDYRQTLLGEETIDGRACYVLEREPSSEQVLAKTGYNRLKVWIDKQNSLVMRQDYFDTRGVMIKQLRTQKVENLDGIDSITLSQVEHFVNGTRSQLRFNQLQYNVELDDKLFTQTAIRRGLKSGDTPEFRVTAR